MRIVLAAIAALALAGCASNLQTPPPVASQQASHTVKIVLANGHGSGVHVGNGFILTAAHVVDKLSEVKLKSSAGDVQVGKVLWANTTYDIALVKAERPARLASAALNCRTADVGEAITAEGNPGNIEFLTAYGRISGGERELGPWKRVLVTDSTTVMGMSGGPVLDDAGNVVGITVGVMSVPVGFGSALTGFGAVVPSSAVCELLGRGE